MLPVVGIRFRRAGKIYHFDAQGFQDLARGEHCIVETTRGEELGWVATPPQEVAAEELAEPLKRIIRRAEPAELREWKRLQALEPEALKFCREKLAELGLPMKVVKAEYNFDGSRLVFSFSAERRVDFRNLVRILAGHFRTRIELRQIGVRDEAKLMGGLGRCGRIICCTSFLCEFSPVSIRMAKNQDLPLSPTEISGLCGRLLCCLSYEDEFYAEARKHLPQVGRRVMSPQGPGQVVSASLTKVAVALEGEEERVQEFSPAELEVLD